MEMTTATAPNWKLLLARVRTVKAAKARASAK